MKILLMLLLMTQFCWADEPEIIDYLGDISQIEITPSSYPEQIEFDSEFLKYHKIKISCPDGYKLVGTIKDRNNRKINCDRARDNLFICVNLYPDLGYMTDAELKCIKE